MANITHFLLILHLLFFALLCFDEADTCELMLIVPTYLSNEYIILFVYFLYFILKYINLIMMIIIMTCLLKISNLILYTIGLIFFFFNSNYPRFMNFVIIIKIKMMVFCTHFSLIFIIIIF